MTTAVMLLAAALTTVGGAPATARLVDGGDSFLGVIDGGGRSRTNAAGDSAVLYSGRGGLYVRTRPAGGAWSRPQLVRSDEYDVNASRLGIDGAGRPTVVWQDDHLWARSRTSGGWQPKRLLQRSGASTAWAMAENDAGAVAVLYLSGDGLEVSYRLPTGGWRQPQLLTRRWVQPMSLRVALDGRGRATVVWTQARVGADWLRTARSGRTGLFGDSEILSPQDSPASHVPDLGVSGSGFVAVGWLQQTGQGPVAMVRTRTAKGAWRTAQRVGTAEPQVAVSPKGGVWSVGEARADGRRTLMMTRKAPGGSWTEPVGLVESPEAFSNVDVTASRAGSAVLTFRRRLDPAATSSHLWLMRAPAFGQPFSEPERVPHSDASSEHEISMSASGDALMAVGSAYEEPGTTGMSDAGPDPVTHLYAMAMDVTGPGVRMVRPRHAFSGGVRVSAEWRAGDNWSEIAGHDLFRSSVAHDGTDHESGWTSRGEARTASFVAVPGRTYCLRVRATDEAGNTGRVSHARCIAVPLDDRDLARSRHWSAVADDGSYRGTVLRTRSRGASVSKVVSTRRVALLARRSPRGGSVTVYLAGRKLGVVSLVAPRVQDRRLLPVAKFAKPRTGRLRVVVTTSGRPVVVDGLATSMR